jgi:hypothetical protein
MQQVGQRAALVAPGENVQSLVNQDGDPHVAAGQLNLRNLHGET